jgi:hypothetical protein
MEQQQQLSMARSLSGVSERTRQQICAATGSGLQLQHYSIVHVVLLRIRNNML